jgi:hypothetical protein
VVCGAGLRLGNSLFSSLLVPSFHLSSEAEGIGLTTQMMGEFADSNPSSRRVKVAIVGSGLAGLTAAYLLSTVHRRTDVRHEDGPVEYEIHVFEKVCTLCFPLPLSPLCWRRSSTPQLFFSVAFAYHLSRRALPLPPSPFRWPRANYFA